MSLGRFEYDGSLLLLRNTGNALPVPPTPGASCWRSVCSWFPSVSGSESGSGSIFFPSIPIPIPTPAPTPIITPIAIETHLSCIENLSNTRGGNRTHVFGPLRVRRKPLVATQHWQRVASATHAWSQLLAIRLLLVPIGVGVGIGIGIDLFSFDSDTDTDPGTDPDYNPYRDRDAFVLY
jgi:hypothetical protein